MPVNPWVSVWWRAVIQPASRRAAGVWVGCAILVAVIFGPTGMQPADLTGLALHVPAFGAVLALVWLLVFLPIARLIVRGEAARYLRSLPGAPGTVAVLSALALLGLQLPWVALWTIGDGLRGAALAGGFSIALALLARWRPIFAAPRVPAWRGAGTALRGVHVRALRRRAGDALLRGTGLALLAGGLAGLFVRNNGVDGANAAVLGTCVIAVALVPAQVGVLLVLLESHRQSTWLAASLGIPSGTRLAALVFAIALVNVAATSLALVAAALVIRADGTTLGLLAATSLAAALGAALGAARVLLDAAEKETVAARTTSGAVVVAAVIVLCLGTVGLPGILAVLAAGGLAIGAVKP